MRARNARPVRDQPLIARMKQQIDDQQRGGAQQYEKEPGKSECMQQGQRDTDYKQAREKNYRPYHTVVTGSARRIQVAILASEAVEAGSKNVATLQGAGDRAGLPGL